MLTSCLPHPLVCILPIFYIDQLLSLASSTLHPVLSIGLFLFILFLFLSFFYSLFLCFLILHCHHLSHCSCLHLAYSTPDALFCIHLSSSLSLPHPCSQIPLKISQLLPIALIFPRQLVFNIKKNK